MSTPPPPRLFGTDGVRGAFGKPPLDRVTVARLGLHLARQLTPGAAERGRPPTVLLGGDTRASTPQICRWLAAGLAAGGAAVRFAGVLPTPGLAWLVSRLGADAAAIVSASHNPAADNGIKLVDRRGFKWPTAAERDLEARLHAAGDDARRRAERDAAAELPAPELVVEEELDRLYLDHLESLLPGRRPLAGLRLAIDAANGAAAPWARELFSRLGADVHAMGDRPDGSNINDGCGSTHPEKLAELTLACGADLGVAFDGDADRALFVDANGEVRDGDATLYLWARSLHGAGKLSPAAIVATSMSNLGLERALAREGVGVVRCDVGDRVVVATMQREGIRLGGEQSGHIVHLGLSTTGDGLLTALQVAAIMRRAERPLAELVAGFRRYPQLLVNVRVARKPPLEDLPAVMTAARRVEEELGSDGRLVLRYSGTEPLARIMIEGPERGTIEEMAGRLAAVIANELAD